MHEYAVDVLEMNDTEQGDMIRDAESQLRKRAPEHWQQKAQSAQQQKLIPVQNVPLYYMHLPSFSGSHCDGSDGLSTQRKFVLGIYPPEIYI
jgi:hypothetical protein